MKIQVLILILIGNHEHVITIELKVTMPLPLNNKGTRLTKYEIRLRFSIRIVYVHYNSSVSFVQMLEGSFEHSFRPILTSLTYNVSQSL